MHRCIALVSTKGLPDEFFHYLGKQGLRAVDLHFHTEASMDAVSHVPNVLGHCRKRGLGVAVTDHSVIAGARNAWKSRNKYGAFVIPGLETIGSRGAHTLYYFYNMKDCEAFYEKEVAALFKKDPFFLPIKEEDLMEKAQDYNALVVGVPHPFGPGATGIFKTKPRADVLNRFDLIEGINAVCTPAMNRRAVHWASVLGKSLTAGSDGHTTAELGNAVTVAPGESIEEFLENVRKGNTLLIGREKNLFDDALHEAWKETVYVRKAKRHGLAERWISEHFSSEMSCLRKKLKRFGHGFIHGYHKFHTPLRQAHAEIKGKMMHE
ncbi:PHP domain-containing protein [Candidatus Woesearchaeota archaeon]|nr:PHP domain-containing protein [Candidatus Woesearchaeota archaeon]